MNKDELQRIIIATFFCVLVMLGYQYFFADKSGNRGVEESPTGQPGGDVLDDEAVATPADASQGAGDVVVEQGESLGSDEAVVIRKAVGEWSVKTVEGAGGDVVLGSVEPTTGYKAEIHIDGDSASVGRVLLSEHKWHVDDETMGYPLLSEITEGKARYSFQLGGLEFEEREERFNLSRGCWTTDGVQHDAEGRSYVEYAATIVDGSASPVFKVIKRFEYEPGRYDAQMRVRFENMTKGALTVRSLQLLGPTGVIREDPRMDRRAIGVGYQNDSSDFEIKQVKAKSLKPDEPRISVKTTGKPLKWYALSNKFFTAIVQPMPQGGSSHVDYIQGDVIDAVNFRKGGNKSDDGLLGTFCKLRSPLAMGSGGTQTYDFRLYFGPLSKDIFDADYSGLHFEKLVPVSWCAFDWLVFGLLWILKGIYALVHNYGIAIMVLVFMVRLIMHPITKKSQVSMMGMSKLKPQMDELKKKYENNPEEFKKRSAELTKEMGLAPVLGCLPMLLQMPIWFALYTAVDTNVAIRHEGLFPASWHWITDLTAPDRLVPFTWLDISPITVPGVGVVDALNLLPILLGVVMFLQMKLNPQMQMASANPQQASQQKMMMWLMPGMMLVFLYMAPSGLNLYIMASITGGLIEQHFIRKHIREREAMEAQGVVATTKKISGRMEPKKKKPRPPQKFM